MNNKLKAIRDRIEQRVARNALAASAELPGDALRQWDSDDLLLLNVAVALEPITRYVAGLQYTGHRVWCPYCCKVLQNSMEHNPTFMSFPHSEGCPGVAFWDAVSQLMDGDGGAWQVCHGNSGPSLSARSNEPIEYDAPRDVVIIDEQLWALERVRTALKEHAKRDNVEIILVTRPDV